MCGLRRKLALSRMSQLRRCAVPGRSHLQCEEKVVQCDESMYRVRGATPAVREQSVWCEDKVCSIRNVTSAVLGEKVCSTRRVASAVREEGRAV